MTQVLNLEEQQFQHQHKVNIVHLDKPLLSRSQNMHVLRSLLVISFVLVCKQIKHFRSVKKSSWTEAICTSTRYFIFHILLTLLIIAYIPSTLNLFANGNITYHQLLEPHCCLVLSPKSSSFLDIVLHYQTQQIIHTSNGVVIR